MAPIVGSFGAASARGFGLFLAGAGVFEFTITSDLTNVDLYNFAIANGWNQTDEAIITVDSSVRIYGDTATDSTPAMLISGSWPSGLTLINNGYIIGRGGNGGNGASAEFGGSGTNGQMGGTAIWAEVFVNIDNSSGTIAGGGGGGGGGGRNFPFFPDDGNPGSGGGGGGGGRSSLDSSRGYISLGGTGGVDAYGFQASSGGNGTFTAAGSGGTGQHPAGGNGGDWGASGASGASGDSPGTTGGAGGIAVKGNSKITWISTGTRLGSITS